MNNISKELEYYFKCTVEYNKSSGAYKLNRELKEINEILTLFINIKFKENVNLYLEFVNIKIIVKYDYNKFTIIADNQIGENIDKEIYHNFVKLYNNPIFDIQIKTSIKTTKLEI